MTTSAAFEALVVRDQPGGVLAKKAQAAIEGLPDLYREAFVLRDLELSTPKWRQR